MIVRPSLLLLLAFLFSFTCIAQINIEPYNWYHADTSLDGRSNLQDLRRQIQSWKEKASAAQNDVLTARSLYYIQLIDDAVTEDTLYFKNSLYIDSVLRSPGSSPLLKSIMHLLKAKRIGHFSSKFFHRASKTLFSSYDPAVDYGALQVGELDSIANVHFEKALDLGASFKTPDAAKSLWWLSDDTSIYLFTPRLNDIIHSERISIFRKNFWNLPIEDVASWLELPLGEFAGTQYKITGPDGIENAAYNYYLKWMQYHAGNEPVYNFIETLLRRDLYRGTPNDSTTTQVYQDYLEKCSSSPFELVKAHAIYQLCLLWKEQALYYNPSAGGLYGYFVNNAFNDKYRMYYAKAIQLYDANEKLFEEFPSLHYALMSMKWSIQRAGIYFKMENNQVPGQPILALLRFRNIKQFHYRVIKWPGFGGVEDNEELHELLKQAAPFKEAVQDIPAQNDYQWHNTYLKIDPLPVGRYFILYADSALTNENIHSNFLEISVSQIAVINKDESVFVLDRQTGFPLAGAKVITGLERHEFKESDTLWSKKPAIVNAQGYVTVKFNETSVVKVEYKGDSVISGVLEPDYNFEDEVYNTEDYDDLQDFYEYNSMAHIYTDRSVYRPGQTVYYKGILFTNNAKTGEPVLFNRKNMPPRLMKRLMGARSLKLRLNIRDPFNRDIDTIQVVTDEYGSFTGSFVIPPDAATGSYDFESKDISVEHSSNRSFTVEEYKRPSFELIIEKPKSQHLPGDSVKVKFIVRSFAGALLDNVLVKYFVTATKTFLGTSAEGYFRYEVIKSQGYTNDQGELIVHILDSTVEGIQWKGDENEYVHYVVNAEAIDATGETGYANLYLPVSTRPIDFSTNLPNAMEKRQVPGVEVMAESNFEGKVQKPVQVKIFKKQPASYVTFLDKWDAIDVSLYEQRQFLDWFPFMQPVPKVDSNEVLIYEAKHIAGGADKLKLPVDLLTAGQYRMEIVCTENGRIIGLTSKDFFIFDKVQNTLPASTAQFDHFTQTTVKSGEKISWTTGNTEKDVYSIYNISYYTKDKKGASLKSVYTIRREMKGVNEWEFIVPKEAVGQMSLTQAYIFNNRLFTQEHRIDIERSGDDPEIIVEHFRSKVTPGGKETFTVSIKTKNEHTAAQLMTTMYDATLDRLEVPVHSWEIPYNWLYSVADNNWTNSIADWVVNRVGHRYIDNLAVMSDFSYNVPSSNQYLHFAAPRIIANDLEADVNSDWSNLSFNLFGQTPGVVVTGYGTPMRNSTDPAPAPGMQQLPAPVSRKNFNETAFFFPRLTAGKDGYYSISFTLPESVTSYKWKMLAHTKDARFIYAEKMIVSQLPLMVQPSMPRFLYQGDKLVLKSRITNMDSISITGKISCHIEDAVTGEDLTNRLVPAAQKDFSIAKNSNSTGSFDIAVPADMLHPLRIKISATSGSYGDGEEHIIPIQAKKILVSQHVAVKAQQKIINRPTLPADATPYGIGISIRPQPKAAMVNALPYLANYPHGCAEQTFNKIFAYAVAIKMMRTDTSLQNFADAKRRLLRESDKSIPRQPSHQTMPWLQLNQQHALQQRQLIKLLDSALAWGMVKKYFAELRQMQNGDGGVSWFMDGASSNYISTYLLAGLGKMRKDVLGMYGDKSQSYMLQTFEAPLIRYCDEQFFQSLKQNEIQSIAQYLYARSYWTKSNPLSQIVLHSVDTLLQKVVPNISRASIGKQALLITVAMRLMPAGSQVHERAKQQLESLRQSAIRDQANGIRWKEIADEDDLDSRQEEWIVKIAEAFEEDPNDRQTVPGIVQWLLQTKTEHNWSTTKATADAISLLYRQQPALIGTAQGWSVKINNSSLLVSNNLVNGALFEFVNLQKQGFPAEIPVSTNTNTDDLGGLHYYYFTENPPTDKNIRLVKSIYRYNSGNSTWEPITAATILKSGDKIKTTIDISTPRQLQYVFIDEKGSAGCEPLNGLSGYQYETHFSYYKSVRDIGHQFFAEKIPAGNSSISYESVVAKTGQFTWGPAELQCMYRPEVKAYSNSLAITVKE
jgi:alpha-2-macroglobulin